MIGNIAEIAPSRIAAVVYRPSDDVDTLLANFAHDLTRRGVRIGGIVQRNVRNANGTTTMLAVDVATGTKISISQTLGGGAMSCKLDTGGLAEAAAVVSRAIRGNVDLIVINKFSRQEASGQGLRAEFADAISRGLPLLTAVPERRFSDWRSFNGDFGTTLACEWSVIANWWQAIGGL
ncbi:DUF2478 domain-containing protein [Bradyrhizobium yuanmingense]|uniref:DUF2478 domain-containing protein n=1 Tax=Bradyrhizobium yuanmingense TaxID=108015 RepID=UPI0012FCA8EB|nr:DUF2478 domain-containing protein [Bradyrhizobium yuanmingense]MVT54039.1 DUF2478 domain-containing protein [Bradyrhizobium yuanmingense]